LGFSGDGEDSSAKADLDSSRLNPASAAVIKAVTSPRRIQRIDRAFIRASIA
jgi:hypothetical protein